MNPLTVNRTATRLDRIIEGGITSLLLFSALPFGSVQPWTQAVIVGAVALLCALWLARVVSTGEIVIRSTPLLWPGLAMMALIGLQLLRPGGSANRYATWESLRLYVAYFAFLFVLSAHLVTRARIVRVLSILTGCGVALAVLALVTRIFGSAGIPWSLEALHSDRLTGTFVTPNQQVLYLSVVFFFALGLLLRPPRRPAFSSRRDTDSLAGGAVDSTHRGKMLVPGAVVIIGVALLLAVSRSGLLGLFIGLLVALALTLYGRMGPRIPLALGSALALLALCTIYPSWASPDDAIERFSTLGQQPLRDLRSPIWHGTVEMVGEAPLLGIGLGAFRDVFPSHRPPGIPSQIVVEHAHNDYLQLLAETGVIGGLLMGWAVLGLVIFVLRRWAVRQDPFVRGVTMGGLGALSVVAVHSATDFGLHLPANALLAVVTGALLPAVVTLQTHPSGRVYRHEWRRSLAPGEKAFGTLLIVVGVALSVLVVAPPVVAHWYVQRAVAATGETGGSPDAITMDDLVRAHQDLRRAVRLDPWSPAVQAALAGSAERIALRVWNTGVNPDGRSLTTLQERQQATQALFATAYAAYQECLRRRPRAAEIHDRFGWFLGNLEAVRRSVSGVSSAQTAVDRRLVPLVETKESLLPRAFSHLREGISRDPQNAYRHRSLALFALTHIREHPAGRKAVVEGFQQALTLQPGLLEDALGHLSSAADGDLLRASVPRRPDFWVALAGHLERQGRRATATSVIEEAVTLASDPMTKREARLAYSRFLLQAGSLDSALAQARQALILDPTSPEIFGALAEIYEAMKQWEEAEAAMTSAVALAASATSRQANGYRARLASLLNRRGEGKRAALLSQRILQEAPDDPWAHFEVARLLEQRGESSEAFRGYHAAQGLGAGDWLLQREIARAYARNGLLQEAATTYETAMRLHPVEEGEVRMELAELYARMGRSDKAIEQYREVLARQPDHAAARRGLASAAIQPVRGTSPQ